MTNYPLGIGFCYSYGKPISSIYTLIYICYKASINGPCFILSGGSLVSPSATYDPLSIGIPHNHPSHSSIMFHIVFHQSHYPSGIKSKSDAFLPKSWHGGSIFWLPKPRLSRLSWGLSILFPFQHVFFPWEKMNICV